MSFIDFYAVKNESQGMQCFWNCFLKRGKVNYYSIQKWKIRPFGNLLFQTKTMYVVHLTLYWKYFCWQKDINRYVGMYNGKWISFVFILSKFVSTFCGFTENVSITILPSIICNCNVDADEYMILYVYDNELCSWTRKNNLSHLNIITFA